MGNTSESEKDTEEAAKNVQNTSSEVSYQQSAPTKPSGSAMTDKEKKTAGSKTTYSGTEAYI